LGGFYVSYTIQSKDEEALRRTLTGREAGYAKVGNFMLVGDRQSDNQDGSIIMELAERISRPLNTAVLAVMNHDDDVLLYWLYRGGHLLDSYNSAPDYFEVTDQPSKPTGGDAKILCEVFGSSQMREVETVLREKFDGKFVFASERHAEIAKLIDLPRVSVGFSSGVLDGYLPDGLEENSVNRIK
jgi:hypothetical protein